MAAAADEKSEEVDVNERKCTFKLTDDMKKSPHVHVSGEYDRCTGPISKIYPDILSHVGMTPMVRINSIGKAEGLKCQLFAKCEFFNAGGSVKDRIGKRMIEDAEREGRIKPGDTLIEPTSGNTGIGLALAAAIKGYKMIITLPEKMSNEKVFVLKALGAEIIRTPTEAAWDSPESHIGVAKKLNESIPNSHILDQYSNPSNPLAHFDGTAEEILKQCDNKIDMVVMTAGTGGTVAGVAAKIKKRLPDCQIVGVDPHGSILALPEKLNEEGIHSYHVEGIGYDFIPRVLNRDVVDTWVKTRDKESFIMARRLIREEGLLCGGSSGTAVVGAIEAIKKAGLDSNPDARIVILLPDSVRNYMSKHLSDNWMVDNNFLSESDLKKKGDGLTSTEKQLWWADHIVQDLPFSQPVTVSDRISVQTAIDILHRTGFDQLPVLKDDKIMGVATAGGLSSKLTSGRLKRSDPITKCIYHNFKTVKLDTSLMELSRIFNIRHFVFVVAEQEMYSDAHSEPAVKQMIVGILTRIDLLRYIVKKGSNQGTPRADGSSTPVDVSAAMKSVAAAKESTAV